MKLLFATLFLILGIIGVIFPIIPGLPFLVVSAFLFGFISEQRLVKILKKSKFKDQKFGRFYNRLVNYGIIKYIYKRKHYLFHR